MFVLRRKSIVAYTLLVVWVGVCVVLLTSLADAHVSTPSPDISVYYSTEAPTDTPQAILSKGGFQPVSAGSVPAARTTWLKITWDKEDLARQQTPILINDYTQFGYVFYYAVKDSQIQREWRAGNEHKASERPQQVYPQFHVDVSDFDFLLVRIDGHPTIPLMFRLISAETLTNEQLINTSWYVAAFSITAVLIIYNLFLFIYLGDRQYLSYCLYLFAQLFTQVRISGYGKLYIWPDVTQKVSEINFFSTMLITVTGVFFVRSFLSQDLITPLAKRVFNGIILLSMIVFVTYAAIPMLKLVFGSIGIHRPLLIGGLAVTALGMVATFGILLDHLRRGDRNASVLIVTYSLMFAAGFVTLFSYFGVMRTSFWSLHALDIAVVFEAIILSLALARKIEGLRQEKLTAELERRAIEQSVSQEILRATEREKLQLGHTLHDDFAHDLLTLKTGLSSRLGSDDTTVAQVDRVIDKVRHLSHSVHPYILEQLGLKAALLDVAETTNAQSQAEDALVISHVIDDVDLGPEANLLLYRIVQSCVNNIIRHADAQEALLVLRSGEDQVELSISDDGTGFDVDAAQGFGLSMLRERCRLLDATLRLHSDDVGTRINITIPKTGGAAALRGTS